MRTNGTKVVESGLSMETEGQHLIHSQTPSQQATYKTHLITVLHVVMDLITRQEVSNIIHINIYAKYKYKQKHPKMSHSAATLPPTFSLSHPPSHLSFPAYALDPVYISHTKSNLTFKTTQVRSHLLFMASQIYSFDTLPYDSRPSPSPKLAH